MAVQYSLTSDTATHYFVPTNNLTYGSGGSASFAGSFNNWPETTYSPDTTLAPSDGLIDDGPNGFPYYATLSMVHPTPAASTEPSRSFTSVYDPFAEPTLGYIGASPYQGPQTSIWPGPVPLSQPAAASPDQGPQTSISPDPLPASQSTAASGVTSTTTGPADRPFVCAHFGCDKSFKRNSGLLRHGRKHEPPFLHCLDKGCRYRDAKGFYRWDKLVNHQQTRHGLGAKHVPWGFVINGGSEIHRVEQGVTKVAPQTMAVLKSCIAGYSPTWHGLTVLCPELFTASSNDVSDVVQLGRLEESQQRYTG